MLSPSVDAFAALARSSPWRWSTLRFTAQWPGDPFRDDHVRAWLRRPDLLRVESMDGELRQVVRESRRQVGVLSPDGGHTGTSPWPGPGPEPVSRLDGLVAERPQGISYDAPMYQNYAWVAMLDPVELADGVDEETGLRVAPVVVGEVTEVDHGGRPAWEAVVSTTPAYEPRCGCCPLLRSREVDLLEYRDHPENLLPEYPEAYRVRLDVGTGVCVLTAAIGGPTPGAGHDLRIEAVDEPMADDLFRRPARPHRRRASGGEPGVLAQ
jgi:hypothetical protein